MARRQSFHWGVLLIATLAAFILVIDTTMMNVSIRALVGGLDTTVSTIHPTIAVSTLVMASFLLIGASLQDSPGRKKAFLTGTAICGAGTSIAAISQNVAMEIGGWFPPSP